ALSQQIEIGAIGLDHNRISRIKFFNHSLRVAAKATNSYSTVELVMQVCFLEAYEMEPPPRKNTQPLVEELSLILLIQLASGYPFRIEDIQYMLNYNP
ncbi:hypothetical protein Tco_1342376, partial [Tanacetum coccineum]